MDKKYVAELLRVLEEPDKLIEAATCRIINTRRHSRKWTLRNQFLMLVQGASDAATGRHWYTFGRVAIDKEQLIWITAPTMITEVDDDTGEKVRKLIGFHDHKVIGIENTRVFDDEKWAQYAPDAEAAAIFLTDMEDRYTDLIKKLDLSSLTADGGGSYFMLTEGNGRVNLGHIDEQVFLHELAHAVDFKLGSLTREQGQQKDNELVAEFTACAIMRSQGKDARHGCAEYLKEYAGTDIVGAISKLMARIQRVIDYMIPPIGAEEVHNG